MKWAAEDIIPSSAAIKINKWSHKITKYHSLFLIEFDGTMCFPDENNERLIACGLLLRSSYYVCVCSVCSLSANTEQMSPCHAKLTAEARNTLSEVNECMFSFRLTCSNNAREIDVNKQQYCVSRRHNFPILIRWLCECKLQVQVQLSFSH